MNDFDEAYSDDQGVFGRPYPALLEALTPLAPGRLLDLGSGQGRNAVPLASAGFDVTAVDASAVGVAQAVTEAKRQGTSITGVVADLTTFEIDGLYDVILLDMVLHALAEEAERGGLLTQVRRAVTPGGTVYVVLPEAGLLADEVVKAFADWPVETAPVAHRLDSGEHAGTYEFLSIRSTAPTEAPT